MSDEKEMKIEIAPGALDDFEGSQEELEEFLAELEAMVADGTLIEHSQPVDLDELEEEDPELYAALMAQLESIENPPTIH